MTRVDFYVVQGDAQVHDRLLCRVIEKAWQHGHGIFVHCADVARARAFDELLWIFSDTSFVPHGLVDAAPAATPVLLGTDAAAVAKPDVLVNLTDAVPAAASRYARVIESAGCDDAGRQAARARYRHYQERGFPLHTHQLGR